MKNKNDFKIHIGQMLTDFCEDKRMTMKSVGKGLDLKGASIAYHQKQTSLNTGTLLKYSVFFGHNFFLDLASKLPKEYTSNAPKAEEEQKVIASLKEELEKSREELQVLENDFKIVKAERDLLKEVMKNK